MLLTVPPEILIAIIRALDRDIRALRNVALVCRALLPIVREELFAVTSERVLEQPYMHPYFKHIVELVIGGRPILSLRRYLDLHSAYCLQTQPLPKLKAIRFVTAHPSFYATLPPELYTALASLTAVTELILCWASFHNLSHAQSLICALPNLSCLSLKEVKFFEGPQTLQSLFLLDIINYPCSAASTRPRLTRLSVVPSPRSSASAAIVAWLGMGPSAESLRTLVVPYQSITAHVVLGHFGSTVEHLQMPLRDLDSTVYSGYLDYYTNLRTLTVFLEAYNACQGPWYLLAPFFEHGILAEHLHTITIDVRMDYPMDLRSAIDWAALDRVNDELDEAKFDGLRKVVFILQWVDRLEWMPAEGEWDAVKRRIEQGLYNLIDAGKLEVRFQVVREYYDSI